MDKLELIVSSLSLLISALNYWKDNRIKLAVYFEPYYYIEESGEKNVIIQGYNKSKLGEAFRFNGISFSRHKIIFILRRKTKKRNIK